MQSMGWQTLLARRARKDPPNARGWNAFLTDWSCADLLNPVMTGYLNAGCDKAMFGWPCDGEIEKLRDAYARETDPGKQKQIAEEVQVGETQVTTHVFLGQWQQPAATRKGVTGIPVSPVPVFWNVEKKSSL
jgi:peptide/nickel transport system substrate-binding protein